MPEVVVKVLPNRPRRNDCAIWSLAVLTGLGYEDILVEVARLDKDGGINGLWFTQVMRIAKMLGVELECRRRFDLHEDVGILGVLTTKRPLLGHAAVLKQGQVIDVDSTVWSVDEWLAHNNYKPTCILVLKK